MIGPNRAVNPRGDMAPMGSAPPMVSEFLFESLVRRNIMSVESARESKTQTKKLPKKLARVLADEIDLYDKERIPDSARLLVERGLVEEYPGLWKDIFTQLIEPAREILDKREEREERKVEKKELRLLREKKDAEAKLLRQLGVETWEKAKDLVSEKPHVRVRGKKVLERLEKLRREIAADERKKQERIKKKQKTIEKRNEIVRLLERRDAVRRVYLGSCSAATKALYKRLESLGNEGVLAAELLRAQKSSDRAKSYRGDSRDYAYGRKAEALAALCKVLESSEYRWGWGRDEGAYLKDVLYLDLPAGQVSWHSTYRFDDCPDYEGKWDGETGKSTGRIIGFAQHTSEITHQR